MQFTINQDYAKRYNEFRRKEVLQKLKDKHGDVKLTKGAVKRETAEGDQLVPTDEDSNASDYSESDSSDSSTSEDSSFSDREHEDFLVLYDALCRNDPALNDPNKQWFRDKRKTKEDLVESQQSVDLNEARSCDISTAEEKCEKKLLKSDHEALSLRDYERQFLLDHRGIEDEVVAREAERVSKLESDEILAKLSQSAVNLSKAMFLAASDAAFKQSAEDESPGCDFLVRRQKSDSITEHDRIASVNFRNLQFTDNQDTEAEEFLRNFILNKRWKQPVDRLPTYEEVLQQANLPTDEQTVTENTDLTEDKILDEDDEFLIKVHEFERANQETNSDTPVKKPFILLNNSSSDLPSFDLPTLGLLNFQVQFPGDKPIAKHRFEEEDQEFIKSYPRKIQNTVQQPATGGTSTRALKRQARRARKLEEKKAKLEELERMRRLKLSMVADKIARIQRSCGSGCGLSTFDFAHVANPDVPLQPTVEAEVLDTVVDLAEHLDEDWDPEKHDRLLSRLFDDAYYDVHEEEQHPPQFSDASDLDSDHIFDPESNTSFARKEKKKSKLSEQHQQDREHQAIAVSSKETFTRVSSEDSDTEASNAGEDQSQPSGIRARRRIRSKARLRRALKRAKAPFDPTVDSDFDHYFEKHYKLPCEDIIPGPTPEEDIYCHFHYRQVKPNDFGLTTEEILTAPTRELNSWIPMNRVTSYRTEEEEERDLRIYHSNKKLQKKTNVLASLTDPNNHWWPADEGERILSSATTSSGKKRKRSRKHRKSRSTNASVGANSDREETKTEPSRINSHPEIHENSRRRLKMSKGINVSAARLAASGITPKDIYRAQNKAKAKRETVEGPDTS
ncbi:hypothetical protein EG68_04120 [Paragonimus skrjabini miyazakii]|uniref:Protein KRI1 homolog n=1 Tax=Paragonimus skrjabini miyazakii TaxID=59628 RepID=A0A8S9YZV3_9TREM|nr:hypothetical protein EG68_04120 [Paragonimus skrjabini miyazakii]